jgi:saccharopine dehydrogenase (NAD+, L-lysine-forming)
MELLSSGEWQGLGVLGPEAFDPDPIVARMAGYDYPYEMKEM